jgi:hypothetical protein
MDSQQMFVEAEMPLHKCCSPNCPGFPYRASDRPHPPDVCTPRKPPTLAELVAKYVAQEEADCGEITAELDALSEAIDEKALNYKRFDEAQGCKEAAERAQYAYYMELAEPFKRRAEAIAKRRKSLREHLLSGMRMTGKMEIETVAGKIWVKCSESVKVGELWVETADEKFVQVTKAPKLAVLLAMYRDKVRELTPKKATEAQKQAAKQEARKALPEGVSIEVSENLQL